MITKHDSAVTRKEIRVGIVGANANASWAKLSHVPAINAPPNEASGSKFFSPLPEFSG